MIEVTKGSGNIFADLGLPEPGLELAKAEVARAIRQAIADRGMTHQQAAIAMGESLPNVAAIMGGRIGRFTLDRLLRSTEALGFGVRMILEPPTSDPAHEACLFRNPDALASIDRGVRQGEAGELQSAGSFAEYADTDLE